MTFREQCRLLWTRQYFAGTLAGSVWGIGCGALLVATYGLPKVIYPVIFIGMPLSALLSRSIAMSGNKKNAIEPQYK